LDRDELIERSAQALEHVDELSTMDTVDLIKIHLHPNFEKSHETVAEAISSAKQFIEQEEWAEAAKSLGEARNELDLLVEEADDVIASKTAHKERQAERLGQAMRGRLKPSSFQSNNPKEWNKKEAKRLSMVLKSNDDDIEEVTGIATSAGRALEQVSKMHDQILKQIGSSRHLAQNEELVTLTHAPGYEPMKQIIINLPPAVLKPTFNVQPPVVNYHPPAITVQAPPAPEVNTFVEVDLKPVEDLVRLLPETTAQAVRNTLPPPAPPAPPRSFKLVRNADGSKVITQHPTPEE
jgi:hypothetical protein